MAVSRTIVLRVLFGVLLVAGCSSGPDTIAPAEIPPVYKIRNSPIPVPDAKWNPRRSHGIPATSRAVAQPVTRQAGANRPQSRSRDKVQLSSGTNHTVTKGETLYSLSKRYGVPLRALISANKLRTPYTLAVGQRLTVPVARVHVVTKGETGYGISRRYGVTASALMKANGIRPPYRLTVGQKLKLPGGAATVVSLPSRVALPKPAPKAVRGRSVAMPAPPPRSKTGFEWPINGKLASRFGPKEGGLHNDGINILASKGAPVKVADAGVVVYASNALEGYGNLLLVKHAGGWITAYAHAERILVRPGQRVKRGDIVARIGSTGGVAKPQLHFEIRKGRQALNPLRYLPGSGALKS